MKKLTLLILLLVFFIVGCSAPEDPVETEPTSAATFATVPVTVPTMPQPTEAETTLPPPIPVVLLNEEEQTLLLKIGMAERGNTDCTECIALVMCTVLNRVNADRFGSTIHSVLYAQDQFTPVMDGTFNSAEPNERCREALDLVIYGWDESQGALYYEWCEGESWHSQNLHLLFQHCDTRFYD